MRSGGLQHASERPLLLHLLSPCCCTQILKDRLGECVRSEGVNYIEKCEQVRGQQGGRSSRQITVLARASPPVPAHTSAAAAGCSLHTQLARRYEAAVRVCQWNSGPRAAKARNVGNVLEREHELRQQLAKEGALPA